MPLVQYLSPLSDFETQTHLYLELRRREGRVLQDHQVAQLPMPPTPQTKKEWDWRAKTYRQFEDCLLRTHGQAPLTLLDLGCGNGWLAGRLSQNPAWDLWAVDVNQPELEQGARVFQRPNLHFYFADILADTLPHDRFDIIFLAASVQYFPDLPQLVAALKQCLRAKGEIHFLDSPFYSDEISALNAKQRTKNYYQQVGFPEMAQFYHHHHWQTLAALGGHRVGETWAHRLCRRLGYVGPFPWVRIKK